MIDEIYCHSNLILVWKQIQEKQSDAGIEEQSIKGFAKNAGRIEANLEIPEKIQSVRRIEIPKASGKTR